MTTSSFAAGFDVKRIGVVISVLSIILLYILASFSIEIAKVKAAACVHPTGGPCPITAHIPVASYFGFILLLGIGYLGIQLASKAGASEKIRKEISMKAEEAAKKLDGDEKKAYELIAASDGVIFQSDLVEKMGYPKMKVTRILDKLEGRNLIERRRRGLTNIVVIKHN